MASAGYGLMAVSGAIAAQFFNLSVGWAVGLIRSISNNGDLHFDLFGMNASESAISMSNTAVYAIVLLVYCTITLIGLIIFPQFTK